MKTFLTHLIFLRTAYLFNHSNCSHPSLEVVYLLLCFKAVISSLKCTVSFSFVVPLNIVCCHSLSFVVTRCHSLPLFVTCCTPHCHSLEFVVSLVVIQCHSVIRSQFLYHLLLLVVTQCTTLFINDLYLKSFCKNKKLANLQIIHQK